MSKEHKTSWSDSLKTNKQKKTAFCKTKYKTWIRSKTVFCLCVFDQGSYLPVIHIGVVAFSHRKTCLWSIVATWDNSTEMNRDDVQIFFSSCQISVFYFIQNTKFFFFFLPHVLHQWTTRVCESFVFYKDSLAKGWPLVWQNTSCNIWKMTKHYIKNRKINEKERCTYLYF